jgi:hypothetical protein
MNFAVELNPYRMTEKKRIKADAPVERSFIDRLFLIFLQLADDIPVPDFNNEYDESML